MADNRSRTQEQIFYDLHRELRVQHADIPESAERLDPIMRLLLQSYAHQLARIDKRLDVTWDESTASLVRSVCPDRGRWPVPAYTVMRCRPVDPSVEVDTHTRFFFKEKREGGQTLFFSPQANSTILDAEVAKIYLRHKQTVYDLSPTTGETETTAQPKNIPVMVPGTWELFVAVNYTGPPSALSGATTFLKGNPQALGQMQWATWYPGAQDGSFYSDSGFCPGMNGGIEKAVSTNGDPGDWGGLRTSKDLFCALHDSFVFLPSAFTDTWELGPIDKDLELQCKAHSIPVPEDGEHFYWMRLELSARGDRSAFQQSIGLYFDCFVATNKSEMTLFKHTGAVRMVEVEIPAKIDSVLEIVSVIDSDTREYHDLHGETVESDQRVYALEERDNKLILWFDFSPFVEPTPDSLTVTYTITAGVKANGIDAGKITALYESHPGISSCENVISVTGAIPAKTREQILSEASLRLRQRDRAVTYEDLSGWATSFDPRIKKAVCKSGVTRGKRGVQRCVIVTIAVNNEDFVSDDEIGLLKHRLQLFLKSRATVNTQFEVEVTGI